MLVPKLVTTLRTYTRQQFAADVVAGVIVGVVALPLAIAFAIASGVTPDRGLYTAVIAGFLISALGGSRVQIGGPTGAFVVIVYGIVQRYGVDGLLAATLMAGVILLILGFARLGGAIKFIPFPVVTGFTAAIGALIAVQQLRDALGLQMPAPPAELIERLVAYAEARRYGQSLRGRPHGLHPAPAPVLAPHQPPGAGAAGRTDRWARSAAQLLDAAGGDHREPIRRDLRRRLPRLVLPSVSLAEVRELVGPAFAIAALGAIESLLSAVVADGMIGGRHRSNMELVAQGVANIASPLFGGMPATGAIARTATNIKSGGRTPVAGIVHALTLLLITLFFGRWAALIPLAVLAAIVLVVAFRLSEWHVFAHELRAPRSDALVMVATFLLTLLVDLTVGIGVGMVLAAFLFMKRMAEVTNITIVRREFEESGARPDGRPGRDLPAADPAGRRGLRDQRTVLLRRGGEVQADPQRRLATAQGADHPHAQRARPSTRPPCTRSRTWSAAPAPRAPQVLLSDVNSQPLIALGRSGLLDVIGEENLFGDVDAALEAARQRLQSAPA